MGLNMDVQGLLKNPQLFAVKKDGILQMRGGLSDDKFALKCGYLMSVHHAVGCGDRACGCIDQAWSDHADGATIVPVTIVETAPEGAVN